MKTIYNLIIGVLLSGSVLSQSVGINSTGALPETSAMLDVADANKGLLVPRVDIVDLNTSLPVTLPATSLLVYNTNVTSGVGYYFWDATKWVKVVDTNSNADEDWHEVGGTSAPNNINDDIFTHGQVGIGVVTPQAQLDLTAVNTEIGFLITKPTGNAGAAQIFLDENRNGTGAHAKHIQFANGANPIVELGVLNSASGLEYFYIDVEQADVGSTAYLTPSMVIRRTGKIGVGTISPEASFQVEQPAWAGAGVSPPQVGVSGATASIGLFDNNTSADNLVVMENDNGNFNMYSTSRTANDWGFDERILRFMIEETTGDVAIGPNAPVARFHVTSEPLGSFINNEQTLMVLQTSPVGNNLYLDVKNRRHTAGTNWTGTNMRIQRRVDNTSQAFIDFGIDGESANYGLAFGTRNGITGSQQTRMVIDEDGLVGVGTIAPNAPMDFGSLKLHKGNGNVSIASDLFMQGQGLIASENNLYINTDVDNNGSGNIYFAKGTETSVATRLVTILNNGNLGVGLANPAFKLQVNTNSAAKPTSNVWTVVSDGRLKENVRPFEGGLKEVIAIDPVWFTYTGEAEMPTDTGVGVIAQDLQKIAPYMISEWTYQNEEDDTTEEYLGVDNGAMTYMLINAIKELKKENDLLKIRLDALENQ